MTSKEEAINRLRTILSKYVPQEALERLVDYIVRRGVHLRITRSRESKYGDYMHPHGDKQYHAISINGDIPHLFFLKVLLHEMAHLETYLQYKNSVRPHGLEWQTEYRNILIAYIDCFPDDIQTLLRKYTSKIPLSRSLASTLRKKLIHYGMEGEKDNAKTSQYQTLNDLIPGTEFHLVRKPNTTFTALERRRTRWLCRNKDNGQLYLVHGTSEIIATP